MPGDCLQMGPKKEGPKFMQRLVDRQKARVKGSKTHDLGGKDVALHCLHPGVARELPPLDDRRG